jgi:hypothetical protein
METVYIETTVVSYLTAQPSRDVRVAGHQQTTQLWWAKRRGEFECFVSKMVIDEISDGDPVEAGKRLDAVKDIFVIQVTGEVAVLTRAIMAGGALPPKAVADATHVAAAAVQGIDFLITWNCKHLANAQIVRKVNSICTNLGYRMPVICTPDELLGE